MKIAFISTLLVVVFFLSVHAGHYSGARAIRQTLLKKIKNNDINDIREYFSRKSRRTRRHLVNGNYPNRTNLLHWAIDPQMTRILLRCRANANSFDSTGALPLHWAPNAGVARLLLKHMNGEYINARDNTGSTPLHYASSAGMVRLYIAHAADVNAKDDIGRTPLFFAPTLAVARALLAAGANVNAVDNNGNIALTTVDSPDVVRFLLVEGADENHVNNDGKTVIELFAERKNWKELFRALLPFGPKIPVNDQNRDEWYQKILEALSYNHLVAACFVGDVERVRNIITHRFFVPWDINQLIQGISPLDAAISQNHTQIVQLLVDNGATVKEYHTNLVSAETPLYQMLVIALKSNINILQESLWGRGVS